MPGLAAGLAIKSRHRTTPCSGDPGATGKFIAMTVRGDDRAAANERVNGC
ncbi:hypothetical protein GCM10022231_02280 [Gordonia caeni]|uniref:Uncharacterized protein n=1 Tax=Gordonia caeni TaxID=1007097 RepID=A0ABP7NJF3_9ACTN